jgi:hypothetical protein
MITVGPDKSEQRTFTSLTIVTWFHMQQKCMAHGMTCQALDGSDSVHFFVIINFQIIIFIKPNIQFII